jgi:uncharacterized protein YjbI with pentapeptide repeats
MANLVKAELTEANFDRANFVGAKFSDANLSSANLRSTILSGANLKGANLKGTNLVEADIRDADFEGANLVGAKLAEANLARANFIRAKLVRVNFKGANLEKADFTEANLESANCKFVNFVGAIFKAANLKNCNLRYSDLRLAELAEADLTGVNLYLSARDGWQIRNVECRYLYFDQDGKERLPKDRDFEIGEFERLYKSIPTVEIVFKEGMKLIDPLVLDYIAQQLHTDKPELGVELLSIDKRGIYPRATFAVAFEEAKKEIEKELIERYENEIKELEADKNRLFRLLELAMQQEPRRQVNIYGGKYLEAHANAAIYEITVNQAIEEIKKAIDQTPATSFEDKSKKKILEHIDNLAKELTKEGAKAVGKRLYDYAKTELVPVIPHILKILSEFNMY